jgi:hypothetical protein
MSFVRMTLEPRNVELSLAPNAGHNRAPGREARREPNNERSDAVRRSG